uniref:uncharacterized protein LOC120347434 n=1 Tax=Styela clava TaxID=7725 RepID=UPI001939D2A9|nr:uncharacterized protein LOC120347434 [Styela clava]
MTQRIAAREECPRKVKSKARAISAAFDLICVDNCGVKHRSDFTMKVLVVGHSKTGTKSMNAALRKLGYKVYDYEHNFYYLRNDWIKIFTKGGTKEDFYRMYKDVDVSMDIPANIFWEEILEAFPDMKMIFMKKNSEEEWIKSWEKQAKSIADNYLMTALAFLSPTAYSIFNYTHHVGRVAFCAPPQRFYHAFRGISPTVAKKRYRDHNTGVLARAPKDQILEFKLSQGWEPLCKFLGKQIPEEDFPHKNRNASVLQDLLNESPVFHQMKFEMKIIVSVLVVLIAIAVFYFFF